MMCILADLAKYLPFHELEVGHDDDVSEVVVRDVGGPQRHHEGPQPDGVALVLGEHGDHHVAREHRHVGLLARDHHLDTCHVTAAHRHVSRDPHLRQRLGRRPVEGARAVILHLEGKLEPEYYT